MQYKKVYLGKSKIAGKGIFAKNDIKKNQSIFIVKGEKIRRTYTSYNAANGCHWLGMDENIWIRTDKNNPCWFLNHSCNPNAGVGGGRTIVAMRNIKKDEEITLDYSTTEVDPWWKMKCTCGAKNCRKLLKSARFLPKNLFKKYKPFMPKFAVKSYLKYNSKIA